MKIKVEIPNTINGIKLVNYQKYNKIMKASPDANDEFLETKLLEIFCGVSYKDIIKMPLGTFDEASQHIHEIFKAKTPLVRRFTMTGSDGVEVEFGFIPNLDKMTMGGARVFFYRLGMKLSRAILNSFQALDLSEEASLSEEEKKLLTANTAGIKNFMHLQTEMLSNYRGLH